MKQTDQAQDCWYRIGVWGTETPRCPRLAEVIHCHNCDVYHAASLRVYERDLADDYREDWTRVLSSGKEAVSKETKSVIVFRLGEEWVALPMILCKEITKMLVIHRLPHNRSKILRGIVNTGGEIEICVSLGAVLGVQKVEAVRENSKQSGFGRMIVVEYGGRRFVFPVSEVGGIHQFHPEELEPLPKTVSDSVVSYMQGIITWDGRHIGCIDPDLLISALDRGLR